LLFAVAVVLAIELLQSSCFTPHSSYKEGVRSWKIMVVCKVMGEEEAMEDVWCGVGRIFNCSLALLDLTQCSVGGYAD